MSTQHHLPHDWHDWLVENITRGCSKQELVGILKSNGFRFVNVAFVESVQKNLNSQNGSAASDQTSAQQQNQGAKYETTFSLKHLSESNANFISCEGQTIRIVSQLEDPRVYYFEDVLTAQECDELISMSEADDRLKRSRVVDIKNGDFTEDYRRTSDSTWFDIEANDLITKIDRRLAALIQWPVKNGEGLQILRYQDGGEYRPHVDYFDPLLSGSKVHLKRGGQRVATIVLYLSDVEEGGGTHFPKLGLKFNPRKGAGLLFANITEDGHLHRNTLHAGLPVTTGVKYIATRWVRERTFI